MESGTGPWHGRAMRTRPRISLCMIAKNEEAFIADCLRSVRGVVHEMMSTISFSTVLLTAVCAAFLGVSRKAKVLRQASQNDEPSIAT